MMDDIDTGSGYYRNPYASGYGMGYQDPYAGMRYLPQSGLMRPLGFGGKGGYSQPMYPSYGFSPYSGMSPGKGGYYGGTPMPFGPSPVDDTQVPAEPPVNPEGSLLDTVIEAGVQTSPDTPVEAAPPIEDGPYIVEDVLPVVDPSGPTSNAMQTYQPMYRPMYPMMRRQQYPMYGGKGGYYR